MRRYFDFTVRVKVEDSVGDVSVNDARKTARDILTYQLLRDGLWLASTSAGAITVTKISAGKWSRDRE